MSKLKRAEELLVKANMAVITIMMFLMFFLVFANVVTRYGLGFSMNWAEEVSRYLMIWIAYLGAGLAMREGRHAAIEVLHDLVPQRLVRYVRGFVAAIILTFMGILVYLGYRYSMFAMNQTTAVLQLPVGLVYLAIPIGSLAFILHLAAIFREYVEKTPVEEDQPSDVSAPKGEN